MGLNETGTTGPGEVSSSAPAVAASVPSRFSALLANTRPIFFITLLGAALRLIFITQPSLWGDEALTYSRVCGTYRQLIDLLQHDGFVPLHHELYWVIAQFFYLTPVVMRIVPIISGILLAPAIYFLARQLVSRPAANLVALLTACSAFMLAYSRDAKMYPDFWLLAVLMMGLYLRWLRKPSGIYWLAWIACGVAMAGLQTVGLILLGLMPIFLLTERQAHWKKMLCVLIGIAVISAGPAGYYLKFNRLIQHTEEEDFAMASGTHWVRGYNEDRTGPSHVAYCTTAFLFAWEWPRKVDQAQVHPATLFWYQSAAVTLLGLIALGAFPWRRRKIAGDSHPPPQPWWRVYLWLGLWLIVPAYIFYCRSMPDFATPRDWINSLPNLFARHWLIVIGCAIVAIPAVYFWRAHLGKLGLIVILTALILFVCQGCSAFFDKNPDGSVWIPRYLGIIWPAFILAVSVLILRLPTRPLRWAVIILLVAVNLQRFAERVMLNFNRDDTGHLLITGSEPPVDLMARDVVASDTPRREILNNRIVYWRPRSNTRVYIYYDRPPIPGPGAGNILGSQGRYYLAIIGGNILTPLEFRSMSPIEGRNNFYAINQDLEPASIGWDVSRNPALNLLIVWQKTGINDLDDTPLLSRLGRQWKLKSVETFKVRQHWIDMDLGTIYRKEFEKVKAGGP